MFRNIRRLAFFFALAGLALAADSGPVKNAISKNIAPDSGGSNAALWHEPLDITSLNLLYGSGGVEHQPHGTFTFLEEDLEGTNPKFDVRDQNGVKWKVKMGAEARPEVAASRLLWAAGYFTNEDYFVEDLHVEGLPSHLHRGQSMVAADGTVHSVRLKRSTKEQEKIGIWRWGSNPFVGTREFNSLRALMALINNWDLKDVNNAVYQEKHPAGSAEPQRIYLVSDLGASFGTTGFTTSLEGSRGNLEAYKRSKFISNRTSEYVDFAAPSRPTLVETFNLPVFLRRMDLRWIGRRVPLEDAKALGSLLGRLSPEQICDAFRAAGYTPEEANEFASVVQTRIIELKAL